MNLRHLRYFAVLAREGHHARAASACSVTQPTLSEGIRQLEGELGVPLIERGGGRFRGLTAEGSRVLTWAQRLLADQDALEQDVAEMREGFVGTLRLGVIPAAMAVAPLVSTPFSRRHPRVRVSITAMTSIGIQRALDDFDLDAGLTYLENEPLHHVRTLALYEERYLLLTPSGGPFAGRGSVTWGEAATLPLCLLSPDMQNRRIIDRMFRDAGVEAPNPRIETGSMLGLAAHVRAGGWSSVVPHTLMVLFGGEAPHGLDAAKLEPAGNQKLGLVVADREPLMPLARALLAVAREVDFVAALNPAPTRDKRRPV